jgi:Domain of unknown function (DUF5348)
MHHLHQIVFCPTSKRWHAYEEQVYCCPIHIGDSISIRIKDRYFQAQVERDTQWYISIEDEKFRLHPKQKYDVILLF